jgi:citrate lyase gamma subunit
VKNQVNNKEVYISESIEVTIPCPVKNQDVEIQSSCTAKRIKKDKEMITEMLDELDVEATPVSVYRLPKNANSNDLRPRLIKLVVATSQDIITFATFVSIYIFIAHQATISLKLNVY